MTGWLTTLHTCCLPVVYVKEGQQILPYSSSIIIAAVFRLASYIILYTIPKYQVWYNIIYWYTYWQLYFFEASAQQEKRANKLLCKLFQVLRSLARDPVAFPKKPRALPGMHVHRLHKEVTGGTQSHTQRHSHELTASQPACDSRLNVSVNALSVLRWTRSSLGLDAGGRSCCVAQHRTIPGSRYRRNPAPVPPFVSSVSLRAGS